MSTTCSRCHRTLKNPIYVKIGMGKICLARSKWASENQQSLYDPEQLEGNPLKVGVIIKRMINGKIATNVQRSLVQHSPTGFEIGYSGSGVADFALNILHIFLPPNGDDTIVYNQKKCSRLAYRLHQQFKDKFLADSDLNRKCKGKNGFTILPVTIKRWIEENK
jgi:hypothetical protein